MKKITALLLSLLVVFLFFSGCSSSNTTENTDSTSESEELAPETLSGPTQYPVTVDDMNGSVEITAVPERIVSLSPSNTETLFALGVGSKVVGRSDQDNYPEEAQSVPVIGSYSSPSAEQIINLSPNLVVATDFIDESVKTQVEATGAKVLVFAPDSVEAVEQYIVDLGEVVDANDKATEIVDGMETKLDEIEQKLESVQGEKSVFIDLGDYFTAGPGSILNDELDLIGARNVAADASAPYPQLSAETVISDNPDVYISLQTPIDDLKKVPGFDSITAFKDNAVFYYSNSSPEKDMINRPGPRIVDGVEVLAKDVYPDSFN